MLKSSLRDYNDAYILVKGAITIVVGQENDTDGNKRLDKRNKGVVQL